MREKMIRSDDEWRELLSRDQFRVLRRAGTETRVAVGGVVGEVLDAGW